MRGVLIRWAILALGIAAASWIFEGVEVSGGVWGHVWVAGILGLVNALVKPVLVLLTLPFTVITLGAFLLVVNAMALGIVDWLSTTIEIDGFGTTLLAALVISVVSWVLSSVISDS